jgi:glutathione-S-conjugate glycine hydrolase
MRAVVATAFGIALAGVVALVALRGGDDDAPELAAPMRTVPASLIPLDTAEGRRLLFGSEAHGSFLPLAAHFLTQDTQTYCGVASIAMVLNAMTVPAPTTSDYAPHRLFTQDNLFSGRTDGIISADRVARQGMSLRQVAQILRAYGVEAEALLASDSNVNAFRDLAVEALQGADRHVIVNYARSALGQDAIGHISPLGAYDADSDRFLVLDVARYKYPPVWVETTALFAAMAATVDGLDRSRGFVLVRRQGAAAEPPMGGAASPSN